MVGVPGRSKACVTCLKRKKRCDLEKPTCGTCRKARVECGGYDRPRIFVNNTIEKQSQLILKKSKSTSTRFDHEDGHASSFSSSGSDVALLPRLARSAYQARYIELFWRIYLPNGKALSIEVTQIALGKWIDAIHDLHDSEPALKKALLAMSLATVGKQENNRYLKEEGRRLYTSSLQSMAVALKDPRRATSDATWTAVRLSSFFESCFGQNDGDVKQVRSWQAHNDGDIALISARSPYSFISGHAHDLFADGRSNLIMHCLRQRKRCFLADADWKSIPWLQREKNPRDYLMDILVDLTGLFEELDNMNVLPKSDIFEREFARQSLLDGFLQIHQDLLTWQLLHAPDFEPLDEVPYSLLPRHIAGAHLMTTFWASVIVITSNIQALCVSDEEFDPTFDLDACCANMIRTFPLFIHPSLGLFRTHVAPFPFTVALHYLCAAGPQKLVEERRIFADCLYDPALSGVQQFISNMKDEIPGEFLH
ncbi:hypothetical protein BDW74DRAFT_180668 [Aspergillus multicolor]|uniref:Zn(II)2Cys6 transcription factor domain-containing protein n=1 Tax=Aspergillus multicolor TaxID=41759 RepID=UPI003CCE38DA